MADKLEQSLYRRLAFIKYLYSVAVNQSNAPEPLASASILTFHDSIELFLQLSSEYLNVGAQQPKFMQYWELLQKREPGVELTQKESMRRLNKARVALKHNGTLPSKLDIEAFRASATNFFEDNVRLVFGTEFSKISLIDFVQPEKARMNLNEAQKLCSDGELEEAINKVAIAFEQMLDDYEERKRSRFGQSPFFIGEDLTWKDSFGLRLGGSEIEDKISEFVDAVKESLEAMQNTIKILALGIDYKKYSRFKLLMPLVHKVLSGDYHLVRNNWYPSIDASEKDVEFCINFIIESAIILQEFDYAVQES